MKVDLESYDVVNLTAVLDDCVDQLIVLGRIMPVANTDHEQVVQDDVTELLTEQKNIENKFQKIQEKNGNAKCKGEVAGRLRQANNMLARGLFNSPLAISTLEKVQNDRLFIEKVLYDTVSELAEKASFNKLTNAVRNEKSNKQKLQNTILSEEDGRRKVKTLAKQILEVKKDKEVELQQRGEMIAHLKDQLQEMKAKTTMESKYIKKVAEVSIAQTQKKCLLSENELKTEIKNLQIKMDEETRVNTEIESYLLTHTTMLQKQVEIWMERYDIDVESKQKELDVLKASKAKDLEKLQNLTKLYSDYEQVVVEDRIEKEQKRRKDSQETLQLKSAVKLQSWWRGIMVRKGLGSFSKKKGKKGKKGGKKGKKGKKK